MDIQSSADQRLSAENYTLTWWFWSWRVC